MARGTGPEIVGEIIALPLAHIVVGRRLRPVDPVWAGALGAIMAVEGQKTPIEVVHVPGDGYVLVSGAHRREGARLQGWDTIRAIVIDADALQRREHEISENLWRQGLSPVDRAAFVAELIAIKKQQAGLDPAADSRAISAAVRWQKALGADAKDATAMMAVAYNLGADVGARIGLSERTIRDDLMLYRRLAADIAASLRSHPIAGNASQLKALAKLSHAEQRELAALLVAGEARSVAEARAIISQAPRPNAETKAWSAFFGAWARMGSRQRRDALRELTARGLPPGFRLSEGEDQ
jgi:ParB-like chromosome segregation protein Spo0J